MSKLDELKSILYDANALHSAVSLMDWDQQTYMPHGGADTRGAHVGILSRMAHETFTKDRVGELLSELAKEVEPGSEEADLVRVTKRDYDLATKLPSTFVAKKSELSSQAHEKWVHARSKNDFKSFAPILEEMFGMARQEAEYLGYKDHIYDALIDQYDEGTTAADVKAMYAEIRGPQVELVREILACPEQPDDSMLTGNWPKQKQSAFTEFLLAGIGFDFNHGRQDEVPHPFCGGVSMTDVRLTNRYNEDISSAIFSALHEGGHGHYEQGSPVKWDRLPLAGGVSLGLHESQSRTWENIVGRSLPFWEFFYPKFQETYPEFQSVSLDKWYRMINKVTPSFIRVEADELTYNLHTMTRFEIECDVLENKLAIKDIPEAWNNKYEEYLGVRPPTDTVGCLQDVHWSGALIGYFPTYTMGNLLSYQIWNVLQRDLGDTDAMMRQGNFAEILGWLKDKIYSKGRSIPPKQLIQQVTGKPMGASDYLEGLSKKYKAIYGIN